MSASLVYYIAYYGIIHYRLSYIALLIYMILC